MRMHERGLIVVDMQNDFAPGGALPVAETHNIVPEVNVWIETFEQYNRPTWFTFDWHPDEMHPHFDTWPVHCRALSEGAALVDGIHIPTKSPFHIVHKGQDPNYDGYSGFDGTAGKIPLANSLQDYGVKEVIVVGVATDFCVKHTAIDAVKNGFSAIVILEATAAVFTDGRLDDAIRDMLQAGVKVYMNDMDGRPQVFGWNEEQKLPEAVAQDLLES